MSDQHTPGKWKRTVFECSNGELNEGVMSERCGVAVCWAHGRTREEEIANAQAIAAFPDLLEFVRARALEGDGDARRLIAKATGSV